MVVKELDSTVEVLRRNPELSVVLLLGYTSVGERLYVEIEERFGRFEPGLVWSGGVLVVR